MTRIDDWIRLAEKTIPEPLSVITLRSDRDISEDIAAALIAYQLQHKQEQAEKKATESRR